MKPTAHDAATSRRMAGQRQKGTKIEETVGTVLRHEGLRYRRNVRSLPGSPDFANKSRCWAIFVNGCFWHHHTNCRKATIPKTNTDFWTTKFAANRDRDARAVRALRRRGYAVVMIWECEKDRIVERLAKILEPRGVDAG
ncbi:very short patch repair endonuclease [Sphingomonas sp. R86521]|uniref:very short patch repair endonuclease n=1 Tax=Sphingomonas sp. R86521 TaxID=3093860 RepID=UPI0036D4239D